MGSGQPGSAGAGSPPAPRRRRRWLVLLVAPLGPLAAGVFEWLYPSEAWWSVWLLPVGTAMHIAQKWEDGKDP
jgi:hypothetical protein